jgi:hypothetical protein
MGRIRAVVAAAIGVVVLCTAPASAEMHSEVDNTPDAAGLASPYDLTHVTWDYTHEALVVTALLETVRRRGVVLTSRSAHEWEGYEVVARSSRWTVGEQGSIRLAVPNSCLFGGYAMDDFRVTSGGPAFSDVADQILSAGRLTSE